MRRTAKAWLVGAVVAVLPALAHAHVGIVSGPSYLNATQEVTFGVGHGCVGFDTYRVHVEIPAGVSSIRPLTSGFGKTSLEKDAAGNITAVIWQKADADLLPADTEYYKLTVRLRVAMPAQAFDTVYFPVHQTCRAPDGNTFVTHWVAKPGDPPLADGGEGEPAAELLVLPARVPGWNKFVIPRALTAAEIAAFFKDAAIVWRGTAAFSSNQLTADLIKTTAGVTVLESLQSNDEIWVKY